MPIPIKIGVSSCLFGQPVRYDGGVASKNGSGLFAAAVARHFPLLPLGEEGRLNDPALRENFIERIFSYRRWKDFLAAQPTLGKLVDFHARHKLLLMAPSPRHYRELGGGWWHRENRCRCRICCDVTKNCLWQG